jgi:hypothetical protein
MVKGRGGGKEKKGRGRGRGRMYACSAERLTRNAVYREQGRGRKPQLEDVPSVFH